MTVQLSVFTGHSNPNVLREYSIQPSNRMFTWVVNLGLRRPVARDVCPAVGTDQGVGGVRGGHPAAVLTPGLAQEAHLEVWTRHVGWQVLVTTHQAVIAQVTRHGSLRQVEIGF